MLLLNHDPPDTFLTFSVPEIGRFSVVGVNPMFWILLSLLCVFQSMINATCAYLIYRFIIEKKGSSASYLLGYGFLIPCLLILPFQIIRLLAIDNMAVMAALVANPGLMLLRCLEAMHGTVPNYARDSVGSFVLYYVSVIQFQFDPKTQRAEKVTRQQFGNKVSKFARDYLIMSLLYSLLIPYSYAPMPKKEIENFFDLFYWGNLLNNYAAATHTGYMLSSGSLGMGVLTELVSGLRTIELNDHPLLKSTSPSDFWGRRWNALVGSGLKRGVFLPMRQYFSKPIAAISTFIASGLLHEYVLALMCYTHGMKQRRNGEPNLYVPKYGTQLIFFLWNGVVLVLESLLHGNRALKWMKNNLPSPLRTALVIMTVLPIAHIFTDEYVQSGIYDDYSIGFPRIVVDPY